MNYSSIKIGSFDPVEAADLGIIFFNAVREGAAGFYNAEQRRAWASRIPSGPDWASRLAAQQTVVARNAGVPIGFMTLANDGYIDLAFVDPAYQRRGVGSLLYAQIEALARKAQMERLYAEASYLVRGLFEQKGWTVLHEQQIERGDVRLTNFVMEKRLAGVVRD
jgi:putative acetyltransferase